MATAVHGGYVSPVAGHQGALDRTELDDLIDELLRDVDDYRRQSPRRPRSRGSTGERSRSSSACDRNELRPAHGEPSMAVSGSTQHLSSNTALQIDIDPDEDVGSIEMSGGSSPVSSYSDTYSMTAAGSGSLSAVRRGRLPSVPESIATNPAPVRQPDQRQCSSDSEDQMSWLAQQKAKLQTKRQEIQSMPRVQSLQHRQLMMELKSTRSFIMRQHTSGDSSSQGLDENEPPQTSSRMLTQTAVTEPKPIRRPDVLSENRLLPVSSEQYNVMSPSSTVTAANEKQYFVEGIERPPFTSNQTKYVFSVSPPAVSPGPKRAQRDVASSSDFTFTSPSNVRRKFQQQHPQQQQQQQQAPVFHWKDGMLIESATSTSPYSDTPYRYNDGLQAEVHTSTSATSSAAVSSRPVRLHSNSAIVELTDILNSIPSPESTTCPRKPSRTTAQSYSSSAPSDASGFSLLSRDHIEQHLTITTTDSSASRNDDFGRGGERVVRPRPIVAGAPRPDRRTDKSDTGPSIDSIDYNIPRAANKNATKNWPGCETKSERAVEANSSRSMFAAVSDVVTKTRAFVDVARGSDGGHQRSTASPNYDRDASISRHRYESSPSTMTSQSGYRYPTTGPRKTGIDVGCQIDNDVSINRVVTGHRTNTSGAQRFQEAQTDHGLSRLSRDSSDSQGTDDFSATEGELLILQPIGQGLLDLEPEPEELEFHLGQSNSTANNAASSKMSRSRSVDWAEKRNLDEPSVGQKADKRRSITPITYTRLDDWQKGRPEVFILDDVIATDQVDAMTADGKSKTSSINYQQKKSDTSQQKTSKSQNRPRKHRKHANSSTNVLPQNVSTGLGLSVSDGAQQAGNGRLASDSRSANTDSGSSSSSATGGSSGGKKASDTSYAADHVNSAGGGAKGAGSCLMLQSGDNVHHSRWTPTSPTSTSHSLLSARTPSPQRGESPSLRYTTPRFVRDSSKYWHKPRISRDEAINYLKNKVAGTFVIRNSNSFPGAFGLALKVAHLPPNVHAKGNDPKADLVRHFLIEPTAKGVRLKGCSTEPVFGSLAALVYQHSLTPLSLPCKLIIPEPPPENSDDDIDTDTNNLSTAQQILNQGAACNVLYVATLDTESLTGPEAIQKTVDFALSLSPAPNTTVVHFKVSSHGITLTDLGHKLFFRRHYPVESVSFCSLDPDERRWSWINGENQLPCSARLFGFVARKHGNSRTTDNACHIFGEIDADQPAEAIVNFVMRVMLSQTRRLS